MWGNAMGNMSDAVRRCDGGLEDVNFIWEIPTLTPSNTHASTLLGLGTESFGNYHGLTSGDTGIHMGKRRGFDKRQCVNLLPGVSIAGTCPKEHFEKWPSWDTIAHQQMWRGWLYQAFVNGMKLMVVSLTESQLMCNLTLSSETKYGCDEYKSILRQILYLRLFALENKDWVAIVESPEEARKAIQEENKLALVIAVEITHLFPEGDIVEQLDELYRLGVRSMQLVHHANNRFSGVAPIPGLIKSARVLEQYSTLASFIKASLPAGNAILDTLSQLQVIPNFDELKGIETAHITGVICRNASGDEGECDGINYLNEMGLTEDGKTLIKAMMQRGMLVDTAHISRKAVRDFYELAVINNNYPMFSSHIHIWETIREASADQPYKNEKYLLPEEIEMFNDTRGMIGLRTGPEKTEAWEPSGVENNCQGSSRSFAQSLAYAVDKGLSVGFGADLNGFIQQMVPRNGHSKESCWGIDHEVKLQKATYKGNPFDEEGLGHIGLLPTLINDMERVGLKQHYLDHINNSAEAFVQLWERVYTESDSRVPLPWMPAINKYLLEDE